MTIQEARNELNSIRVARTRIREKQEQIAELRAMQEGVKAIVYDKERVQSSPTNALESTMVSLILKEEELKQATDDWIKKIGEVEKKIGQIGSPTHETVLIEKFITLLPLWKIAENMNYTERHIYRIYKEAVWYYSQIDRNDVI